MKEMYSLTHSCMHSFASFAIFALSGRACFKIRATGAKFRMLASNCAGVDRLSGPIACSCKDDNLRGMVVGCYWSQTNKATTENAEVLELVQARILYSAVISKGLPGSISHHY